MSWVLFWSLWVVFCANVDPTFGAKSVTLNKVTLWGGNLDALGAMLVAS